MSKLSLSIYKRKLKNLKTLRMFSFVENNQISISYQKEKRKIPLHGCNQHFSQELCAVIFILYQAGLQSGDIKRSAASRRADSNCFYILQPFNSGYISGIICHLPIWWNNWYLLDMSGIWGCFRSLHRMCPLSFISHICRFLSQ